MPSSLRVISLDDVTKELSGQKVVKVLLLGNSGAGKSYLCNALLGGTVFRSEYSARSVTDRVTCAVCDDLIEPTSGIKWVVYDIPGLIESDKTNAERNTTMITKAFQHLPDAPVVMLFVVIPSGGRLKEEDIYAWRLLSDYVPDMAKPSRLHFIVNQVAVGVFKTAEKMAAYTTTIQSIIVRSTGAAMGCTLIRKEDDGGEEGTNMAYARAQVLLALRSVKHIQPAAIAAGAVLVLYRAAHEAELRNLKDSMAQMVLQRKKVAETRLSEMDQALAIHAAWLKSSQLAAAEMEERAKAKQVKHKNFALRTERGLSRADIAREALLRAKLQEMERIACAENDFGKQQRLFAFQEWSRAKTLLHWGCMRRETDASKRQALVKKFEEDIFMFEESTLR